MGSDGVVFFGDGVKVKARPKHLPPVIPVIFVPGVMGSNLRVASGAVHEVRKVFEEEGRGADFTREAWLPPTVSHSAKVLGGHLWKEFRNQDSASVRMAKRWEGYGPKIRQALLSPAMTEVDPDGLIPKLPPPAAKESVAPKVAAPAPPAPAVPSPAAPIVK